MTLLDLRSNFLYGSIPSEMGKPINVGKSFTCKIGSLRELRFLRLGYNDLSGSIPTQLGKTISSILLLVTARRSSRAANIS